MQFGFGIHDEGAIARDGFADRLAGHQQQAGALGTGGQFDAVAIFQHAQIGIADLALAGCDRALVDGDEGRVAGIDGLAQRGTGLQHDIDQGRLDGDRTGRPFHARGARSGQHAQRGAVACLHGDRVPGELLIAGIRHLHVRGQVHPQLEAPQAAVFLFGDFGVDDAAAGRHPLDAAALDHAGMALVVAMAHLAIQHDGDGFKTAMRVVGKAGHVVGAVVGADLVQHQEGVQLHQAAMAQHAGQLDAGPVRGRLAARNPGDPACAGLRVRADHCVGRSHVMRSLSCGPWGRYLEPR